jgi:hypothetical protein
MLEITKTDKCWEPSMKKPVFGFLLVLYVTSFPTFVSATNYHEYEKFDTSCPIGKRQAAAPTVIPGGRPALARGMFAIAGMGCGDEQVV